MAQTSSNLSLFKVRHSDRSMVACTAFVEGGGVRDSDVRVPLLQLRHGQQGAAAQTCDIAADASFVATDGGYVARGVDHRELRREAHETLVKLTIPRETRDQELQIQRKEHALAQLKRKEQTASIDRRIA